MSQHDEMIWQVINHQFCSYKSTLAKSKGPNRDARQFCKHPYSTTGVCNRSSCPLANSKYATIREENGRIHLYIKTVERAHSPKNLWEKIYLSRNYAKALGQLDEHLAYFPKAQVHRNKQRLTKIHQYLLRMRKLKLREINGRKASMTRVHRKVEQREERREKKALIAAKIENTIEKELVERLSHGERMETFTTSPEVPYQKALESLTEKETEEESEEELETEDEMSDEEEMEGMMEYVEDLDEEDEEEEDDLEDMQTHDNAWDDESESEDSEEGESEEDDEDESSEGVSEDESGSGSDGDSKEGDSSGEEEGKNPSKPSKKKNQLPSKKNEQPRRGVRVEIEYEDENDDLLEKESADATAGGGAGLAW